MVVLAVPALAHPFDRDYGTNGNGIFLDSPALTRLAEALGLTPDELASRLQEGEILAQIAREQGIPEEELVEAIVSPHADQIALRVKYGYLTESQAETLLETARERATWLLEQDLSQADLDTAAGPVRLRGRIDRVDARKEPVDVVVIQVEGVPQIGQRAAVHRDAGVPFPAVLLERSLEIGKEGKLSQGDPFVDHCHRQRKTRNEKEGCR